MRGLDITSRSTRTLLAAFFSIAAMFGYSFRLVRVQGASMEPSFFPGQWLLVRRSNWPFFDLHRGEIVVFRHSRDILVKRVAGLPGDLPPLDDLRVLRFLRPGELGRDSCYGKRIASLLSPIPAGRVYVLGDNGAISEDSRFFGPIPVSSIVGRVVQWETPDAPEREQIGYVSGGHALAQASVHEVGGGKRDRTR